MRRLQVLAVLLCLLLAASPALAEDFSVKLEKMAEIDRDRAVPKWVLEAVPDTKAGGSQTTPDMPVQIREVHMRLEGHGSILLGRSRTVGPSAKQLQRGVRPPEGRVWRRGLDQASVVAGWIRNAPDLLLVAWVDEPCPGGTGLTWYHSCLIARLAEGTNTVLLRRSGAITCRPQDYSYRRGIETYFFAYDADADVLTERISRHVELWSAAPCALHHRTKGHWLGDGFVAAIRERVVHKHTYVGGVLASASIELFYRPQKLGTARGIAEFYLGPLAPRRVILDANPELAAEWKNTHPGAFIYPTADKWIRIPVPESWLRMRYAGRASASSTPSGPLGPVQPAPSEGVRKPKSETSPKAPRESMTETDA